MYNKYLKFVNKLSENINDLNYNYSNIIILCVGTRNIIGDSIGPIIGTNIKKIENEYIKIFGTLQETVNFINAREIVTSLYNDYENPYIITIDAALGKNVGDISVSKGYIKLGKALEKNICFYSNINIKCIVGKSTNLKISNINELNKVSINTINTMASIVTCGIEDVLKKIKIYV